MVWSDTVSLHGRHSLHSTHSAALVALTSLLWAQILQYVLLRDVWAARTLARLKIDALSQPVDPPGNPKARRNAHITSPRGPTVALAQPRSHGALCPRRRQA